MKLSVEQKLEKLTQRVQEIQRIARDPLVVDVRLKIGKMVEETFRALGEIKD